MSPVLRFAARSDIGLVRQNNEDSAYAGPRLLALADGMGGHAAGEVASQLLVAALSRLDEDQPGADLTGLLKQAMEEGNQAVADHVDAHPELEGMGCTLTALLVDGRRAGLLHVGDSRAYLLRDGALTQITRDDTFVQSLVDEGKLSADEAHSHPQRSLILKALTGESVDPTLVTRELRVGDRYLLCSDGLSDPVSFDTIAETLSSGTPEESADRLVSLALRSGGPDNVTVVVADVADDHQIASEPVIVGAASSETPSSESQGADTAAGRAAAFSRSLASATTAGPATGEPAAGAEGDPEDLDEAPPRGSRWRFAVSVVGVLIVLATLVLGSAMLIRSNYFVGENGSQVVVKRGISGDLFGLSLASVDQIGCLSADGGLTLHDPAAIPVGCNVFTLGDLREPAREVVRGGMPSGSASDARTQISRLAQDSLLPSCTNFAKNLTTPAAPRPSTRTPSSPMTSASAPATATSASPEVPPVPASETHEAVPGENCRAVN